MRSEIIAVGTELLSSTRAETNSLFLTAKLNALGVKVFRKYVVGDRRSDIVAALEAALEKSEIVCLTGGLGPTNDDLTREVVAEYLELPLAEDADLLAALKERYERFRLPLRANSRRQASVPLGGEILPNPKGTAPGILIRNADRLIFLLPGPPAELQPMVEAHVLPLIQKHKGLRPLFSSHLKVAGEAESRVDTLVGPIYREYPEIETTILSSVGIISLDFVWHGAADEELARQALDELSGRVRQRLGQSVFTDREETLSDVVGRLLREKTLTLAVAESCTGGLVGKMLTDTAGSSDYFLGGVVAYGNELKQTLLAVEGASLERFGAVSSEVAEQMAAGIRGVAGSDIGLSTTGIAGPGGGSEEKPVGLVYLGLADGNRCESRRLQLPGDREGVRIRAARLALDWVRRWLS